MGGDRNDALGSWGPIKTSASMLVLGFDDEFGMKTVWRKYAFREFLKRNGVQCRVCSMMMKMKRKLGL